MCGRYYIAEDDDDILAVLASMQQEAKTGDVYPSNGAPVLTKSGAALMKWGFPRYDGSGLIINARSETAADKKMFAAPLREGRCLVPASGYYEWRREGDKKTKYRLWSDGGSIYMAGLYKKTADGDSFVVMTREAAESIAFIHDRMPVIFRGDSCREWLEGEPDALQYALKDIRFSAV